MENSTTNIQVTKKLIQEKGLYSISPRRKITKNLVSITLFVLTLLVLLPLFNIMYSILHYGLPPLLKDFPHYFVTTSDASIVKNQGAQNVIWSSLILILTTCAFSLPIGIPAGIYLASSNNSKFISIVRLIADVLQSTPSVILGFVIYVWWIIPRGPTGYGWTAGALALSFLMIPFVTRTTEEGMRTVPTAIYEAATSLGIPEWRITFSIALKSASSVILAGVSLAIARIAGETAPLVMTMLDSDRFGGFNKASAALPLKIFIYQYVSNPWTASAWAMSLILIGIILMINLTTRTPILSKLWNYVTFKMMMIEFAIVVIIQTILSLSTNFALFLLISLVLKYLIYDVLQNEDVFYKIWDNIIGRIAILFILLESFLELIVFVFGTYDLKTYTLIDNIINQIFTVYSQHGYIINFRLSEFLVVGLCAYYIYKHYKSGFKPLDKIRLLIGYTFGILLIRLTFFSLFLDFFNNIFLFMIIGLVLTYTLLFSVKRDKIISINIFNYFLLIISGLASIEILLYMAGYLTNYIYQINYRLSIGLVILLGLYYSFSYFNTKVKNQTLDMVEIMKYLLTISYGGIIFFLTFQQNNIILYVFLCTILLHFFIWYIILDNGYFYWIWGHFFGKLLIYLECLEVIIQAFLVIVHRYDNYVYQINNRLFYLLALAIILFVLSKYIYDQKTNYDRAKAILLGLFSVSILQYVYPSLIPINLSLTYTSAELIFGQFLFGLLLKTAIVTISLSKKEYGTIWNKISVKIILFIGLIETIFEIFVILTNMYVKMTIPIIITVNGLLIYFVIFYFLLDYLFKIDIIVKIFNRDVINYG